MRRRCAAPNSLKAEVDDLPVLPDSDPLDDATVLVTGRGRTYPALTTAVGERVGLIGALAVETAAKYLNARDIDGIIIGEGFGARTVDAFLTALADDSRFRDLPVARAVRPSDTASTAAACPISNASTASRPAIVERMLPLVRLHALRGAAAAPARRARSQGHARSADRPVHHPRLPARSRPRRAGRPRARHRPVARPLHVPADDRPARQPRRRPAGQPPGAQRRFRLPRQRRLDPAGVFRHRPCASAHVVARRIASVLRHTMLLSESAEGKQLRIDPTVTLAALKANDTVESLLGAGVRAVAGCRRLTALPILLLDLVSRSHRMSDPPTPCRSPSSPTSSARGASSASGGWKQAIALRPDIPVAVHWHPYFLNRWIPREGISREQYSDHQVRLGRALCRHRPARRRGGARPKASPMRWTRSHASPTRSTAIA